MPTNRHAWSTNEHGIFFVIDTVIFLLNYFTVVSRTFRKPKLEIFSMKFYHISNTKKGLDKLLKHHYTAYIYFLLSSKCYYVDLQILQRCKTCNPQHLEFFRIISVGYYRMLSQFLFTIFALIY